MDLIHIKITKYIKEQAFYDLKKICRKISKNILNNEIHRGMKSQEKKNKQTREE